MARLTLFRLLVILALISGSSLTNALLAQTPDFESLEAAARAASGEDRVVKFLVVADAYLAGGNNEAALEWASEAAEFAKRIRKTELRAKALNREGKALNGTEKRKGLFGREKPSPKFIQSNQLLREAKSADRALMLDNLQNLRVLAQRAGKYAEIAAIDVQINELNNGGSLVVVDGSSRSDLRQEVSSLSQELNQQRKARDTTEARAARLLAQSQALQSQLAEREAAISQMSQEQMRSEMMLMQQRQMMDSLIYRGRVDSLSLSNQNLALLEAETSRNLSYAVAAALLLLFGGSLYSFINARQNARVLTEKNKIIESERQRSEGLLLNILPALVAEELKKQGRTSARLHDDVGVLFADFVNFSRIAEQLSPQQLVNDLDTCFKEFDRIVTSHGLEKIKTIGDAYMCASGLSYGVGGSHSTALVRAASEMQAWLMSWNAERAAEGLPKYEARIGIHRGPVVAGVVGSKKFAFDIWGDTVNIAARIEQAGEGGKINVSGPIYEAIKHQINCQYRGKVAAKNKGEIEMYFVEN